MSDILFWNEARKELNEDKLLSKCDTFVDSLMANGVAYPHIFDMNMDNVAGKTADSIRREMSRLYKLLTKKLKDVTPLTDEFQIHKGFLGKVKGANEEATYLPLVLLFDDGQILTGLAKRYDDGGYKVVKWFLNDEDVTKSVYGNKTRDILADKNYNELAKRLAIIVNYNHKKFVRRNNNPIQKEITELEKKKEELKKKKDELKKQIELLNNEKEQEEPIQEEVKEEPQVSEEPLLDTEETEEAINEELEKNGITLQDIKDNPDIINSLKGYKISFLGDGRVEVNKTPIFKNDILIIENNKVYIIKPIHFKYSTNKKGEFEKVKTLIEPNFNQINVIKSYKNMTNEEKKENAVELANIFQNRINEISSTLKITRNMFKMDIIGLGNVIGSEIFGARDNLEPLDDYIAKIKASPEYQKYIKENTPQDEPINEPQQDNEIEEKLKALLESDNPEYIDSQLDEIMENMSDEEFEKYEELMREVNNKIKQLISNKRG